MFIETVTQPSEEFHRWSGTAVNVWDEPGAIADMFLERVQPVIEELGPGTNKPDRHGAPVHAYIRPHTG